MIRQLWNNQKADSPIYVLMVIMIAIVVYTFTLLLFAPLVDAFLDTVNNINIPLSEWGSSMMMSIPMRYAAWIYYIPGFFIAVLLAWGFKTVVRRHKYSVQDQYESSEFD